MWLRGSLSQERDLFWSVFVVSQIVELILNISLVSLKDWIATVRCFVQVLFIWVLIYKTFWTFITVIMLLYWHTFLSNCSISRGTWVCFWEIVLIQLNLICLHRVEQSIKSLLWYQKYQKNKKVYCFFLETFFHLCHFTPPVIFFLKWFSVSSWTFWAAIHRRRHPSGKNVKNAHYNPFYCA